MPSKAGRPKEFNSELHVHTDKKDKRAFKALCAKHEADTGESTDMSKTLRTYMKDCIKAGMILAVIAFASGCIEINSFDIENISIDGYEYYDEEEEEGGGGGDTQVDTRAA